MAFYAVKYRQGLAAIWLLYLHLGPEKIQLTLELCGHIKHKTCTRLTLGSEPCGTVSPLRYGYDPPLRLLLCFSLCTYCNFLKEISFQDKMKKSEILARHRE